MLQIQKVLRCSHESVWLNLEWSYPFDWKPNHFPQLALNTLTKMASHYGLISHFATTIQDLLIIQRRPHVVPSDLMHPRGTWLPSKMFCCFFFTIFCFSFMNPYSIDMSVHKNKKQLTFFCDFWGIFKTFCMYSTLPQWIMKYELMFFRKSLVLVISLHFNPHA